MSPQLAFFGRSKEFLLALPSIAPGSCTERIFRPNFRTSYLSPSLVKDPPPAKTSREPGTEPTPIQSSAQAVDLPVTGNPHTHSNDKAKSRENSEKGAEGLEMVRAPAFLPVVVEDEGRDSSDDPDGNSSQHQLHIASSIRHTLISSKVNPAGF